MSIENPENDAELIWGAPTLRDAHAYLDEAIAEAELIDVADVDRENDELKTRLSSAEAEAAALRQALRAISTLRRRNDGFAAVRIASDALEESDAGAALLARLASLTAALEPFARFCAVYDKGYVLQAQRDEDVVFAFSDASLTLGDLRRAAETLEGE